MRKGLKGREINTCKILLANNREENIANLVKSVCVWVSYTNLWVGKSCKSMQDFQELKGICTIEELRTSYLYLEFNKVVSLFFYIKCRKERGKILFAYSYVQLLLRTKYLYINIRRKSLFKK